MKGVLEGWASTTLGEICTKPQYGWTTKASPREGSIKLVRTTDITKGRIDWKTVPFCTEGPEDEEKYRLRSGDIVISRAGSVGASMLLQDPIPRAVFASYLIRFRSRLGVDPRFVGFFLKSARYWAAVHGSASGIALPNVNAKKLAALDLPLAPLPEQHRIVARIEDLFAKLDLGVDALKRAEANLERYRASVLKSAVEGRLTERWRRENPPEETGPELLVRILAERRKCWEEEQLAKFESKGRKPPKNWKAKYKEPVAPDTAKLPELPEGWCWASLEALCHVQLGKMLSRSAREGRENRRPYLRNSNVRWFSVDQTDLKSMSFKDSELEKFAVRSGDLLVCEGGEPGRCSVYTGLGDVLMYQKALHHARPYSEDVSTDFLQYCLAHQVAHGIGMPRYSETTIRHLTLEKIKAVPLPLAPATEQRRIARLIASQRVFADHASGTIRMSQQGASALRQSILQRAFEGGLVPQDPADEPASVLLERIRADRKAERKRRKRRRTKPRRQRRSRVP